MIAAVFKGHHIRTV